MARVLTFYRLCSPTESGDAMAITDQNAVLIIGAGVSAPFNVPLGGQLIDEIRDQLTREREALDIQGKRRPHNLLEAAVAAANNYDLFLRYPIHTTLAMKHEKSDMLHIADVEPDMFRLHDLRMLLDGQTSETIDDFIVQNPAMAETSKTAIATVLFLRCFRLNKEKQFVPRPLDRRRAGHLFPNADFVAQPNLNQRNWIHHLINIIRNSRNPQCGFDGRIKIITFNYDMILEYVLDQQFANTERQHGDWRQFIDIHHVHGSCGPIERPQERVDFVIRRWGEGIHVVNDQTISEPVQRARIDAWNLVANARKIHCVGFAFGDANRALLGLDAKRGGTLNYCNYDANVGVKMSADKCGCAPRSQTEQAIDARPKLEVIENANSDRRPMEVADWFRIGYAGPLPA
jgi:hypothetical protein